MTWLTGRVRGAEIRAIGQRSYLTRLVRIAYLARVPRKYSLYEAKSRLSELVRQVREGGSPVTITVHGRPVAELRRLDDQGGVKSTEERHAELARAGLVHRVAAPPGERPFPLGVRRPGALARFLEARE